MYSGQEIVLAQELDIPYALICMVDNVANGLDVKPLTEPEFRAGMLTVFYMLM
jgi:purine nucleoside phosphorylase